MPQVHDARTELVNTTDLHPHPRNPRQGDVGAIIESIKHNGWYGAIIAQRRTGHVLAGNHRLQAARHLGIDRVPVIWLDVSDDQAVRILLADNRTNDIASYDDSSLADLLVSLTSTDDQLLGTGYDGDDLDQMLADLADPATSAPETPQARPVGSLRDRFGAPPFTVLDTRQGYWQDRKRAWLALGLQSDLGRDAVAIKAQASLNAIAAQRRTHADSITNVQGAPDAPDWSHNGMARIVSGTSMFDPVLAELMIRWYAPGGGVILDPFAGGSVRGIVSSALHRSYTGIDLRPEQVQANEDQWRDIGPNLPRAGRRRAPKPTWLTGDSAQLLPDLDISADMILTCPPYGDLERYSDDPADLSAMPADEFASTYQTIMRAAADRLQPDRFAVIVVSEYRLRDGTYAGLVPMTISAMRDAGLAYYAEGSLINAVGTLAIRASAQFVGNRKLLRSHQSVLVFVKGDARAACAACDTSEDAVIDLAADDAPDTSTGDSIARYEIDA